jgi:hypothetical protein
MARVSPNGRAFAWAVPVLAEAAALGRSVAFAWAHRPGGTGPRHDAGADRAADRDGERCGRRPSHGASPRRAFPRASGRPARCECDPRLRGGDRAGLHGADPRASLRRRARGRLLRASWRSCRSCAVSRISTFAGPNVCGATDRMAVVEAGATLAMAASILPAAALLGDHRAMTVVLIAHALALPSCPMRRHAGLQAAVLARRARPHLALRRAADPERSDAVRHLLRRSHDRRGCL